VAVSTLAAAALFNPLRRRVQRTVDHRFNRARYDADQTVTAFADRLKDAVDLDSVRHDLVAVVEKSLQPAHLSVWVQAVTRDPSLPGLMAPRPGVRPDPRPRRARTPDSGSNRRPR
jgi:hypothetical protein